MIHSVPFEFFAKNQFMYFDISRLAALEKITGRSITKMFGNEETTGVNFVIMACQIGLSHHNFKTDYASLIEKYLDSGGKLSDLEIAISSAILASGIFGKSIADRAVGKETEEPQEDPNAQLPEGE